MSRYRHWWWPNVARALRTYPYLKSLQGEDPDVVVTPSYSGMPRGGGSSRPTERAAAKRRLSEREETFVAAVDRAMASAEQWPDGQAVIKLIQMVDFQRRYTVTGAALKLHMSEATAKRRRARFIDLVGLFYGF